MELYLRKKKYYEDNIRIHKEELELVWRVRLEILKTELALLTERLEVTTDELERSELTKQIDEKNHLITSHEIDILMLELMIRNFEDEYEDFMKNH